MVLLYGENCVILVSTAFDWSTRVTDGQTDRQTDRRTDGHATTANIRIKSTVRNVHWNS